MLNPCPASIAHYPCRPSPQSGEGEWTETLLWSFGGFQEDGVGANNIAIGTDGALYGTTISGGQYYVSPFYTTLGTVFSLTPPAAKGAAWTENLLWSFGGPASSGAGPNGVIVGSGGVLCGITSGGLPGGIKGTVFSLSPPTSPGGAWTEQDLHGFLFDHQTGGFAPYGYPVQGAKGELYGTTFGGGTGGGTVFVLRPPVSAGAPWSFAILLDFPSSGPAGPQAGLIQGSNGVLYGTTSAGPQETPTGAVFALAP